MQRLRMSEATRAFYQDIERHVARDDWKSLVRLLVEYERPFVLVLRHLCALQATYDALSVDEQLTLEDDAPARAVSDLLPAITALQYERDSLERVVLRLRGVVQELLPARTE